MFVVLGAALSALAGCEPAPAPAPAPRVTYVVGDSNTVGASWATQLAADCTPDRWAWGGTGILRAGYTGGAGPITLDANLEAMMDGRTADHVVIMLGTNDALGRDALPTVAQLDALAARFRATGASSVRWVTIPPFGSTESATTRSRRDTLNSRIAQTPNHLDSSGAFGGASTLPPNLAADSIHLNALGHATLGYHMAVNTTMCGN